MTEGEKTRLIAWSTELRAVHRRLRDALSVTRENAAGELPAGPLPRELLLFCHGFCTALTGHHQGEDRELFPAIAAAHPELAPTLRRLEQDHVLIAELVDGLQAAIQGRMSAEAVETHLARIAAIMESHFQYEERQLLTVLDTLALDADPHDVLGPL
ncbi:MAG TPA: hemerythrin domain-containing protein [Lacisediminihabitans sp.]|uniref:hemerythrin domain-containing protein n=1 Tax=Lacisediminihabitans sp. TaxID=2787631 RepID=UPI002EDBACB5